MTVAASPTRFPEILEIDLSSNKVQVIKTSTDLSIDESYLSVPETLEFPSAGNSVSHGFFYPPMNRDFKGMDKEVPPLVVMLHGQLTKLVLQSVILELMAVMHT